MAAHELPGGGLEPFAPAAPLSVGAGRRKRSKWWIAPIGVVVVAVLALTTSVVGAVRTPGNESFKAKWADWLRSHHAQVLVNHMEAFYYGHKVPAKGGQPAALNQVPPTVLPAQPAVVLPAHLPKPAAIALTVAPALPGEGQWLPTGPLIDGNPGMYVAQFRADRIYTSQITSAAWIDPSALRINLVPGSTEPGGSWVETPFIGGAAARRAVAAFNGGFRFQDARGGFYLDGREAVRLRNGAASVVLYRDGRVNVGAWGRQVTLGPDVAGVLQNLVPLIDNGVLSAAATHGDNRIWGNTLGAKTVVARSGIGVTANGALVYVAGPALTVLTLAEALERVGCVRAMTLDLNPEWVTFNIFQSADPSKIAATKLYPQMQRPASRFLGPTRESRDFFTVSMPE